MRCEAACTVAFRLLHLTDHDRLSWALKRLYGEIRHRVHLVDVVVRQNHRGPHVCPYTTLAEKMRDGQRYRAEEGIPGLAIDDLSGTTHQVSGGMADPTYLIDANGRVAFYNMWTHVPTLYCAVRELARQGGVGTVLGGTDHIMHFAPAMTEGWRAIQRRLTQSYVEIAALGMGVSLWIGYQLRGLLVPVTQRERPSSRAGKIGLAAAGLGSLDRWVAARWRPTHPSRCTWVRSPACLRRAACAA